MSNTVITIAICVVLFVTIAFALIKGIWSAAKIITVPIQIVLFIVMLVCVGRLLCTKENAQKIYDGVKKTGISQQMENTMRSAVNVKLTDDPVVVPASSDVEVTTSMVADVAVKETPAPQPRADSVPTLEKSPDVSHLNKGKKFFTYALPFNAKVTVGFKDGTYRVIADSLGRLDASDKKEIGKMIVKALGEYTETEISGLDKSKISINPQYDEAENHTRVFAVVPPGAIE